MLSVLRTGMDIAEEAKRATEGSTVERYILILFLISWGEYQL